MPRPVFVTLDLNGIARCAKCRAEIKRDSTGSLPETCPGCGRDLDYSVYMIRCKLNETKRKDETK